MVNHALASTSASTAIALLSESLDPSPRPLVMDTTASTSHESEPATPSLKRGNRLWTGPFYGPQTSSDRYDIVRDPSLVDQKWERGSYEYDLQLSDFTKQWPNKAEFEAWLDLECRNNGFDFVSAGPKKPGSSNTHQLETLVYLCHRQGSGGAKKYIKKEESKKAHKNPRKIQSKRVCHLLPIYRADALYANIQELSQLEGGCPAKLVVKAYPGRDTMLGKYESSHSHELGQNNLKFMRLSRTIREKIESLLRYGVEVRKVVSTLAFSFAAVLDTSSNDLYFIVILNPD